MDLETAQINTTAKLPILKQENRNSFKPAAQTTTNADGSSTTLIPGPVTADEKTQKKNDVTARNMLLMAFPNEHLLTFNQYKDAKTLFAAIQTRFGVPRKNNMYSVDMKNIVLKESLTCLVAKATLDESMIWHKRLGHVNFKTINKLVEDNLVKGLPIKHFENNQTCVACLKGKQHKASFVTNDYSRFTWVFFLESKDETSDILKSFITQIENIVDKKVKIIRCNNGAEFENRVMSEFCEKKCIKRKFSVARTPQQNGVAEKRNKILIEDARTMLADSKLPTTF
ncbi:putative ribonuclease H-like domain-containing protein [Tanacetum coccineum]